MSLPRLAARLNRAVFAAEARRRDGGGRPCGIGVARSRHRIGESVVRRQIEAAGFRLVKEAQFLRNPNDPRDEIVLRAKQPVDEFVLKHVKP